MRDDYADPWDSRGGRSMSSGGRSMSSGGGGMMPSSSSSRGMDTYQDPFDSRKKDLDDARRAPYPYDNGMSSSREDYADPFDTKFSGEKAKAQQSHMESQPGADEEEADYDEPYEQKPTMNDTYEDPWDTRRSIDLSEVVKDRPKVVPPPSQVVNIKSPRRDDYSDPWDSKGQSSSLTTNDDFDDAYADPYDDKAKKKYENKKKKANNSSSSKDDDDDDLYDMPYEEKEMIGIAPKPNPNQGYLYNQFLYELQHLNTLLLEVSSKSLKTLCSTIQSLMLM